jgi:plastocyanin
MRRWTSLATVGIVVAAASCGGGGGDGTGPSNSGNPGGTPGGSTSSSITVRDNSFSPSATTVSVGTAVTWTWAAGSAVHNVTFNDGPASGSQAGGAYVRTFGSAGSYPYRCTIHGAAMSGTVTVR